MIARVGGSWYVINVRIGQERIVLLVACRRPSRCVRSSLCSLLVYVDDATGTLMELRFVEVESTFDYFASTVRYLKRHGKPVAFYSDKHSIFRLYDQGATGRVKA